MNDDSPQIEMLGDRGAQLRVDVEEELARGCRDAAHALVKCYEVSNLAPKQLYGPLGIDQSYFSKILSGRAFLDPNLRIDWMDRCNNLIPLRYDVWRVGHEMKRIPTSLEAENAQLKADLAQADAVIHRLGQMMRGVK